MVIAPRAQVPSIAAGIERLPDEARQLLVDLRRHCFLLLENPPAPLGIARMIPVPIHLGLDVIGGAFLAISPWLFGFADDIWWPQVVFGLLEIGTGLMTKTAPADKTASDRAARA